MIAYALSHLLVKRPLNIGNALSLTDFLDKDLLSIGGGLFTKSASGMRVNHETALQIGAVWQAVAMISGDIAMMPFNVFKRLDNGFRDVDEMHDVDYLISDQPNEDMPAFELWRRHLVHTLLWQNGYLWVEKEARAKSGRVLGLYNLLPDRTRPKRDEDSGSLIYETQVSRPGGGFEKEILAAHEVIHTKGLGIENDEAYDLVKAARDAWGLALAAQGFASKFFANGAGSGGILEVPAAYSEPAKNNLVEGFVKGKTGPDNWFKVAILRDGAKFHATTVSPKDAELTQLSEVQVRQVARYFNLPPFKLGLEDSNAYNSAEMAQLVYLMSCLNQWMEAVRTSCSIKLLSERERRSRSHFLAHDPSVLVRTDRSTMIDNLLDLRGAKVIHANDVLAALHLPPREDEDATKYENPNTSSDKATSGTNEGNVEVPAEPTDAQRRLVQSMLSRVGRRVSGKLQKMDADKWQLEEPRQRRMFADDMRPVADTLSSDGQGLCRMLEDEFFAQVESLLNDEGDAHETLSRTLPESIAKRLGENNGLATHQSGAA